MNINRCQFEPLSEASRSVPGIVIIERRHILSSDNLANPEVWINSHGKEAVGKFTLPPNIELQFYCNHGWSLEANIRRLSRMRPQNVSGLRLSGEQESYDYILEKFQGRHDPSFESYQQVVQQSLKTQSTIVTIRNRFFNENML